MCDPSASRDANIVREKLALYEPILQEVRKVLILKMAKPPEVRPKMALTCGSSTKKDELMNLEPSLDEHFDQISERNSAQELQA